MHAIIYVALSILVTGAGAEPRTADTGGPASAPYDLLIDGGTLIDGSGEPGRQADLLIRGDRIARIGQIEAADVSVKRVIDATGLVVTPGFIDAHSHGDPLKRPGLDNFLAMGVTTICVGQDGSSPSNLGSWMRQVEASRTGANIVPFVGHGTVRKLSGVGLQPDPTPTQMQAMQSLVRQAMVRGCWGLTTGLEYQPGSFADLDELIALAKPVAAANGLVMSHMRSEDDDKISGALGELLAQGQGSGCPVHVSHIKVTYGHGAPRAEQVLEQMQTARQAGLTVTADIYPYTASYTGIGIVFPDWAKPPHDYTEVVKSRRGELADYLRRRVTLRNGPDATLLGSGPHAGKTLAQVANELGKPFEDVLIDDITLSGASAAYFVMDAELQDRLLIEPQVMICSDGSATSRHPRGHGAFARVIRKFVVEDQRLPLEEAVHKMTGLSAATVGLDRLRRGRLAQGWAADVLIFDPLGVRDNATYEKPHRLATGFDRVIVNGQVVRVKDRPTGLRAGRLLRRPSDSTLQQTVDSLLLDFDGTDTPGASVAIVRDGELLLARGYGLANVEDKTPANSHTNYRIASVTKQFTALCIVMLKERGLLSYDDPISKLFPDFPEIGKRITVRHLIGHTSGLVAYEEVIPEGQTAQLRDSDVLALLAKQHGTYFTPGTQYRYSNTGYALLALIVEKVSGTDFATFLTDNIFKPLGMSATVAYEKSVSEVSSRAYGYQQAGDGFIDADQSLTSAVLGDGGIYTSVIDYLKWDASLYDTTLVSRAGLDGVFTPGSLTDGTSTGYGFGWRIEQRGPWLVCHHDGGTSGFNHAVRRVPDQRLTLVIFTNRAGKDARRIADVLLDWMQLNLPACAPLPEATSDQDPDQWQWRDARDLSIEGRGWADTEGAYRRLPGRAKSSVPSMVWDLSKHTAGLCVRFVTDSTRIGATWDGGGAMNHMAATGNSGLDLYRRTGDEWRFCGVGRPQTSTTTATVARNLPAEPTEYLLYLPLYNDVTNLQIGIEPMANIKPAPPRPAKPIVFYGTSITQGGCASRAGMCHPAILGRWLDREVINLGFSGSGKMEPQLADLIGELDPALFVLECLPNMTTEMVRQRVVPFVGMLRKARPDTPILLVESPLKPLHNEGNEALRQVYAELKAGKVAKLHYLPGEQQLSGAENGTVDGVHPTDLGFYRMAVCYKPVLRQVLSGDGG